MKKSLILLFALCLTTAAFCRKIPKIYAGQADSLAMKHWVDSVFDSMTPEERIGQLFMPVVEVKNTAANKEVIRKYIQDYKVGGMLYSKGTASDQAELTNYAQSIARIPAFVSLDGEWGLSMRLEGTPRFPRNMMLGAITNDSLLYAYGREVGRECREMGIHINFAPVLDLNSNPANPVIGTRSFGEDKEAVAKKGIAYGEGLESYGVMAVGKHFPGHGDTAEDSHHLLPKLTHNAERMYSYEIDPFRRYIDAGLSGMLTAHLAIPSLDTENNRPSSLSPKIVNGILKEELGFEGLIFTDGLAMKGVSNQPDFCVKALKAGNDVLLGPYPLATHVENVKRAVSKGDLPMSVVEEKCIRILQYKYLTGLASKPAPIKTQGLTARLNAAETETLNRRLHAEAITVLKNEKEILPLQRLDEKKVAVVTVGKPVGNEFAATLAKYGKQSDYTMDAASTAAATAKIVADTKQANLLIVGIYSNKAAEVNFVRTLCAGRKYILVFFNTPYRLKSYAAQIREAQAVVMGYENSALAQEYAAQVIYGGIGAKGKLSVGLPGLFPINTGIETRKTRLGYDTPESVGIDSEKLSRIDEIVQEGLDEKAFPGCQILVAKDGKVIFEKSYGYFDYARTKKVENDDVYDLASVTKAAATVPALMKVRDSYDITMTQKMSAYIPQLKGTDKAGLTFREALFHETGLASGHPFYRMAIDLEGLNAPLFKGVRDANYRLQVDQKLYAHKDFKYKPELISPIKAAGYDLQIAEGMYLNPAFKDSVLNKLIEQPLKNRGKYRYSCLNFVLLRQAVENITKKDFDKYVQSEVFAPLGADNLMYKPLGKIDRSKIAPTENDHFLRKQILIGFPHDEIAAFEGGVEGNAGLFGNAGDLAKLSQLYLNQGEYGGERIFTEETSRLFTMSKSPRSRRGLGFDKPNTLAPVNSPTAIPVPASVFGHTGYTGTCFWMDPDNNLTYIFLTNRVYPNRWNNKLSKSNYRTRIQTAIYEAMSTKKKK